MKILILSTNDLFGGAARGAFRLHESLLQNKIDSIMLVMNKKSQMESIITYKKKSKNILYRICIKIKYNINKLYKIKYRKYLINNSWGPFSLAKTRNKKLVKMINEIKPDIVHLRWICRDMIAIEDLANIKAPIVWSLPDMWAFTGGCHYVSGYDTMCDKYTNHCQKCSLLGSKKIKDLSFKVLKRKKNVYAKIPNMTIVGVSKWLADCAKQSAVFSNRNIACLPNPLNTKIFKPINKLISRELWNFPTEKKLVLFGAISAVSTPYKGYDLLIKALNKIIVEDIEFIIFGSSEPHNPPKLRYKTHYTGHLNDNVSLVTLYNACDVMVVPSLREAFGQTASESLSCGTPVVAFGHGGLLDIIDHKINGYLAEPFDTSDLAKGIEWVINNENYDELCKKAREKVVQEFDYNVVAKKYINLYKSVLN